MVVLAAAVITKSGKPLVSRQFMDMSRIRIEGLLAAFPKLVGTGKQHTFLETENIRYVFQPMESLYLLLLTNRASNIVEDLDTLRLISKVIPEYANPIEEDSVIKKAFEIMFAFDEVISMGRKENIQLTQIKQNIEMESMEEKLHKMIMQSKIDETKDHMRKVAKKLDQEKIEKAKAERAAAAAATGTGSSNMTGLGSHATSISSSSATGLDSKSISNTNDYDIGTMPRFNRAGSDALTTTQNKKVSGKKGMVLGKGNKGKSIIDSLREEGESVEIDVIPNKSKKTSKVKPIYNEPVAITINEKVNVQLNRDGGIQNFTISGTMTIEVFTEECSKIEIDLELGNKTGYNFKTHPNINKTLFVNENKITLKDLDKPFPLETALGVLKWKWTSKDENKLPIIVNCWATPTGNETYVNMDYEVSNNYELKSVVISIPISSDKAPTINEIDGDSRFDPRKGTLDWEIDFINDSNKTGALEFVVSAADADEFFPVDISFESMNLLCNLDVGSVCDMNTKEDVKFALSKILESGEYQII